MDGKIHDAATTTGSHRRRFLGRAAAGLAAPMWALPARAATLQIRGVATNLVSDNERCISYRHQQHLVQTADGALHLLFNRGTLTPGPGLGLWSSFDGGLTWQLMAAFAGTDDKSTGDAQLDGSTLRMVHHSLDFQVWYSELVYDAVLRTWTLAFQQLAWTSRQWQAQNPCLAVDALGTIWVGFTAKKGTSGNLRVINRVGGGTTWTDPNLVFGPTDGKALERSARPIVVPGGMGMVWTVHSNTYWSTRANSLPDNSAWTQTLLYSGTPINGVEDPYASHFNVVAAADGTLHLISIEQYDVLYFRWSPSTGAWTAPVVTDDARKVAYGQIGIVNGKPATGFSVQRGKGLLVVSADDGATFVPYAELLLPITYPGVNYNTARVELPGRTVGPTMPILQQFADNAGQKLMLFSVPAP